MLLGVTAISGSVFTSPRSSRTVTPEQIGLWIGPLWGGPLVSLETRACNRAPMRAPCRERRAASLITNDAKTLQRAQRPVALATAPAGEERVQRQPLGDPTQPILPSTAAPSGLPDPEKGRVRAKTINPAASVCTSPLASTLQTSPKRTKVQHSCSSPRQIL